jgi:A/G-specific adenine glycosylase
MLHAAAKVVVRELSGRFPETAEELRELPGVGRYTAAAIASIAFGEAVAVVDGNVERVLQRLSGRQLAGEEFWLAAKVLLDRMRSGDFNQAMMELGATVCTPRAPSCLSCPVVELCATRGEMAGAPKVARQKKREIHYALAHRDGVVFLVQRAPNARLMPGMWELPEVNGPQRKGTLAFTVRHSITTTDYTVYVWGNGVFEDILGKMVAVHRLPRLAMTGLTRKILRRAGLMTASNVQAGRTIL